MTFQEHFKFLRKPLPVLFLVGEIFMQTPFFNESIFDRFDLDV